MHIKGLQEPDDDCRKKDYRKGFRNEILCLFPKELSNAFCTRHTVIWKFHNKRYRLALIEGLLSKHSDDDTGQYAEKIQAYHHKSSMMWKKGSRKKCIYRKFCGTTHKRNQKHSQLSIPLGW